MKRINKRRKKNIITDQKKSHCVDGATKKLCTMDAKHRVFFVQFTTTYKLHYRWSPLSKHLFHFIFFLLFLFCSKASHVKHQRIFLQKERKIHWINPISVYVCYWHLMMCIACSTRILEYSLHAIFFACHHHHYAMNKIYIHR